MKGEVTLGIRAHIAGDASRAFCFFVRSEREVAAFHGFSEGNPRLSVGSIDRLAGLHAGTTTATLRIAQPLHPPRRFSFARRPIVSIGRDIRSHLVRGYVVSMAGPHSASFLPAYAPAVINVRHRTDGTGYCDQTALGALTAPAAVFVRSDRANIIDRTEWVEPLTFAMGN
jgi:hypothetical protein